MQLMLGVVETVVASLWAHNVGIVIGVLAFAFAAVNLIGSPAVPIAIQACNSGSCACSVVVPTAVTTKPQQVGALPVRADRHTRPRFLSRNDNRIHRGESFSAFVQATLDCAFDSRAATDAHLADSLYGA